MYVIDDNLPWFTDLSKLSENIYINIITSKHCDDTNPNGLYSGFISNDIFYTSIWSNSLGKFSSFEIAVKDIDKYLFLEYLNNATPKQKIDTPIADSLADLFKKLGKEPFDDIKPPPFDIDKSRQPKDNDIYKSPIGDNPLKKYMNNYKIIYDSPQFKSLQQQFEDILSGRC